MVSEAAGEQGELKGGCEWKCKKKDWEKAVPYCYLMLLKTHFREIWYRLSSGTWGFRRSFMERKEATGADCLVSVWKVRELKVEEFQSLEICVELTGFWVGLEWEGRKTGSGMKQNQIFTLKKYISNGGIMMCTSGQESFCCCLDGTLVFILRQCSRPLILSTTQKGKYYYYF